MKLLCFLFLFISVEGCQYHGKATDKDIELYNVMFCQKKPAKPIGPSGQPLPAIYNTNKLASMDDVLEYQSLLHACKMIKQNMKAIGDRRMLVEDAVETSITLYLKGVDSWVADVLLKDIQANGFNL